MKLAYKEWVTDLVKKIINKTFISHQGNSYDGFVIRFGIDEDGNCGYIKDGETQIRRF